MDVPQTCRIVGGESVCTIDKWVVHLSKGVTVTFLPNPKVNQTGAPGGLLKEIRDPHGNVTTATWIAFGDALRPNYIQKLTHPVGRVTTFTWEWESSPIASRPVCCHDPGPQPADQRVCRADEPHAAGRERFRVAGRTHSYTDIAAIQRDVDRFLEYYNLQGATRATG